MNRLRRIAVLTVGVILTTSLPTHAWNTVGHMAVAFVAYQKLDQTTKDRVDALLLLNPDRANWLRLIPSSASAGEKKMRIFMIAATWPDRIKSITTNKKKHITGYTDDTEDPNRPDGKPSNRQNIGYSDFFKHKYWHFVDTPFSQDGTPLEAIPDPNALTQIVAFRKVLASGEPDALKSYDLSWLLHLVGDVHQPLHCAARFSKKLPHGDAGGNLVKLCAKPCKDQLHGFWDGLLGSGTFPSIAINVGKNLAEAGAGAADLDTEHWITESFELAKSDAYVKPPIGAGGGPFTLTNKYRAAAKTRARERAALAGARLAKILNDELK